MGSYSERAFAASGALREHAPSYRRADDGLRPIQTTYTHARANLASLCDEVTANREVVIIQRRNAEDVALIAAAELDNLFETAYLLRSPKNAERLLTAVARARQNTVKPQSVEELRRELGLDEPAS